MTDESKPSEVINNESILKQLKFFKIIGLILFIITLLLSFLVIIKYFPKKKTMSQNPSTNIVEKETKKNKLFFSNQHLDQPISQYDYALLSSPDVVDEQRNKIWQPMECLYSDEERDYYSLSDISKYITEQALIDGLQNIEKYEYKVIIKNEEGSLEEYSFLQNIVYTSICKDKQNYYVLYLTQGEKKSNQGLLPIKDVNAAGGWLGQSNFAIILFSGETKIYENINTKSRNISISDLSKGGFSSSTSRSFAYYSCHNFIGKLGEDLYIVCGGEGGNSLFKIELNPISFTEMSFCWWLMSEGTRVCYDKQGKVYYQYKQGR